MIFSWLYGFYFTFFHVSFFICVYLVYDFNTNTNNTGHIEFVYNGPILFGATHHWTFPLSRPVFTVLHSKVWAGAYSREYLGGISIIPNFCFLFLPPLKLHVKQQQWNVHGDDWRADRAGVHDAVQERVLESERRKRYADELKEAEARRHSDYIR